MTFTTLYVRPLTSTHRLAVGYDLPVELVHGHERGGVVVEVDEAVGGGLARELVLDHLDGVDQRLAHQGQRRPEEVLVHVRLQLEQGRERGNGAHTLIQC